MSEIIDWIKEQRKELSSYIKPMLEANLEFIKTKWPDTYGYALMVNESIDSLHAFSISNTESDYEKYDDDYKDEARYIVDEWEHWHDDAFTSLKEHMANIYTQFRLKHPSNEDSCVYSDTEVIYRDEILNGYLDALIECKKAGSLKDMPFSMVYASDSDLEVMRESVLILNTGNELNRAIIGYPEEE